MQLVINTKMPYSGSFHKEEADPGGQSAHEEIDGILAIFRQWIMSLAQRPNATASLPSFLRKPESRYFPGASREPDWLPLFNGVTWQPRGPRFRGRNLDSRLHGNDSGSAVPHLCRTKSIGSSAIKHAKYFSKNEYICSIKKC